MEALFGLGSNVNNKLDFLTSSMQLIEKYIGQIVSKSSIYTSEYWGGGESQEDYLNAVVAVETDQEVDRIEKWIKQIEKECGRVERNKKWAKREIDLDLLIYGNKIETQDSFIIPHKYMHLRKFVLIPAEEIRPDMIHPVYKKSIRELLRSCPDPSHVHLYKDAIE